MKESEILSWTMFHMQPYQNRIMYWRNNTGQAMINGRPVKFGAVGSADILGVCNGWMFGVETKTVKGTVRVEQKLWRERFERHGGLYVLVRGVDTPDEIKELIHKELIEKLLTTL